MVEARWEQTSEFYATFWRDWLRTRSAFRKWSLPLGITFVVCGTTVLLVADNRFFGLPLIGLGVYELAWHVWDRARWFRAMTSAKHTGEVVMQFEADQIRHAGPTSRGEMSWAAIEELVRGRDGLFLVLQRGISMYVPFAAFASRDDPAAVAEMFTASRAQGEVQR